MLTTPRRTNSKSKKRLLSFIVKFNLNVFLYLREILKLSYKNEYSNFTNANGSDNDCKMNVI